MFNRVYRLAGIIAISCAEVAWADNNATIAAGSQFGFTSGKAGTSGGDVLFTGSSITPQGKATVYNIPVMGQSYYDSLSQAVLSSFPSLLYSQAPISGTSLVVGDIFAVRTNDGNLAKALITSISSTSLGLEYLVFGSSTGSGGSGGSSGPTITAILNNYSFTPAGFPNSGIAQNAIFIIKGSGMADPNAQAVLQDSSKGLPNTLNGASVKIVDSSGKTVTPVFYYAIASQLALVLPSNTANGTAQVTVTYNGQTSNSFQIQVVQTAMGFDSLYGTGSGPAVVTNNSTGAVFTYNNSIPQGGEAVLWGSGLGGYAAGDTTYQPGAFPINNLAHIYTGSVEATIEYQGASGYPGLDQIVIRLSQNAPTGCNVPLVGITAGGVPTNFLTLPIGNGACADSVFGISGSLLQTLSGQTTVKTGTVAIEHFIMPAATGGGTQVTDGAFATFSSETGSSYGASGAFITPGSCIVNQFTTGSGGGTVSFNGLQAGAITVSSPSGSAPVTLQEPVVGEYTAQLPSGFVPSGGGVFPTHGAGGSDVGTFDTTVNFADPPTWTNQTSAANVNRAAGLPLTWSFATPPSSNALMFVEGTASGSGAEGSFTCIFQASALQGTVPSYVTGAMPAGTGSVSLFEYSDLKTFTASGIDIGFSESFWGDQINATYQ